MRLKGFEGEDRNAGLRAADREAKLRSLAVLEWLSEVVAKVVRDKHFVRYAKAAFWVFVVSECFDVLARVWELSR